MSRHCCKNIKLFLNTEKYDKGLREFKYNF